MMELQYRGFADADVSIELPASKSISNRYLILQALSANKQPIHHLSTANDTQLLKSLLLQDSNSYDVQDAGTVYRFLIPYLCLKEGRHIIMGTERLMQRPILPLIESLRQLGANITFDGKQVSIDGGTIRSSETYISRKQSSQFASALLLSAAAFPKGLQLELLDEAVSLPYLNLTLDALRLASVSFDINDRYIHIPPQAIQLPECTVESDWSSAAFFYQFSLLIKHKSIKLTRLNIASKQGDAELIRLFRLLGVHTSICENGLRLQFDESLPVPSIIEIDGKDIPDIVPSVAVTCAALGIEAVIRNVEHLQHKESNRIEVLQKNLKPFGVQFDMSDNTLHLKSTGIKNQTIYINTASDHRMAMAFAPLCIHNNVFIDDGNCVRKSFPGYWQEISKLGINIHER